MGAQAATAPETYTQEVATQAASAQAGSMQAAFAQAAAAQMAAQAAVQSTAVVPDGAGGCWCWVPDEPQTDSLGLSQGSYPSTVISPPYPGCYSSAAISPPYPATNTPFPVAVYEPTSSSSTQQYLPVAPVQAAALGPVSPAQAMYR